MRLTKEEQRYLQCLAQEMTFKEMAIELGMTVEEVEQFGMKFFDGYSKLRSGITAQPVEETMKLARDASKTSYSPPR
jgi:hypothetical protein